MATENGSGSPLGATLPDMAALDLNNSLDATEQIVIIPNGGDESQSALSAALVDSPVSSVSEQGAQAAQDDNDTSIASIGQVQPLAQLRSKYHRHMARSALKRDSVQALPSIRDLQLHFSGGGARVEHRAGAGVGIKGSSTLTEVVEDEPESIGLGRPSSRQRDRPAWVDMKLPRVGAAEARTQAAELVASVRTRWRLAEPDKAPSPPEDLRAVLVETAGAVRRVRTLALSVVPRGQRRVSLPVRESVPFSVPSRPAPRPRNTRVVSHDSASRAADSSSKLRRAALDLLGQLRHLEERYRKVILAPTISFTPDHTGERGRPVATATDSSLERQYTGASSTSASPSRLSRAGSSSSSRRLSSPSKERPYSPFDEIWSDEEGEYNVNTIAALADAEQPREPWEDRLVSEQRAYRYPAAESWSTDSAATRQAVGRWVEVVELVFGDGGPDDSAAASASTWTTSEASDLARTHAFLTIYLSPEHAKLLPPPTDEEALTTRLSDGYLLVQAFNGHVGASSRPWGFIPPDDVHDTLSSATDTGREWTFRRVGNLTCWAASVRMRYNLPIALPSLPVPSAGVSGADGRTIATQSPSSPAARRPRAVDFDPLTVAKRLNGWETILTDVLRLWLGAAAKEAAVPPSPSPVSAASTAAAAAAAAPAGEE